MISAAEERLTIEPPPVSFIARTASRQPRIVPLDIDRIDLAPVCERRRLDIAEDSDAGAVDENIEPPEGRDDRVNHRAPARFVGHVLREHEIRVGPERLQACSVAVGGCDLRAFADGTVRLSPARCPTPAGYQRDLACEAPRPVRSLPPP